MVESKLSKAPLLRPIGCFGSVAVSLSNDMRTANYCEKRPHGGSIEAMRKTLLLLLVAVLPAHAEVVVLDCEHDGGIQTSDGLPSGLSPEFIRIEVDLEKATVVLPEADFLELRQIRIRNLYVSFLIDLEPVTNSIFLSRRYRISRSTGRLYVHQFGVGDDGNEIDIRATGVCSKSSRIF